MPNAGSSNSRAWSTAHALPAFRAVATGLRHWRTELLAYVDEPSTNC
jgi:hypothetical protein